jgi:hypothetical protein
MDLSDREIEARELAVKEVAKLLASSESLQNVCCSSHECSVEYRENNSLTCPSSE